MREECLVMERKEQSHTDMLVVIGAKQWWAGLRCGRILISNISNTLSRQTLPPVSRWMGFLRKSFKSFSYSARGVPDKCLHFPAHRTEQCPEPLSPLPCGAELLTGPVGEETLRMWVGKHSTRQLGPPGPSQSCIKHSQPVCFPTSVFKSCFPVQTCFSQ